MANPKKVANNGLFDLGFKYHDSVPLTAMLDIVKGAGFVLPPDDEIPFVLCGRDGTAIVPLTLPGRKADFGLRFTWYKMDVTGRYEIVAYVG